MQRLTLTFLASILISAQASLALASGSFSGGSNTYDNRQLKPVDQTYETGKAIFKGRKKGEPSLEYEFSKNLYQCDKPEQLVAQGLTRDSLLYVLYYLNKRHRLGLKGS